MKLVYRGVEYDYTPDPVRYGEDYGIGIYRGIPVNLQHIEGIHTDVHPVYDLKYRGVAYTTDQDTLEKSRAILTDKRQKAQKRLRWILSRM